MDPAPEDPATLGRYRITARLGADATRVVLLGVDSSGWRAALTVVHPGPAAEPGFRDWFRGELQAASAAPPWFVVPVLDADPDAERPWVATAYIEGPSLRAYVAEHGPLGEAGTIALAVRMADGLVALHGAGLAHRHLGPSAVVLADDGPRLIDFGVPRIAGAAGDPEFRAPEQVAGEGDAGPATDVFTFGALVGFAATGRSPFAADSAAGVSYRIAHAEPDLGPITGRLRDGVLGCLAKDPAARPTAAQMRDLLRSLDQPAPAVAATVVAPVQQAGVAAPYRPPGGPAQPRPAARRWGVVAAIVAAALAGAGIAVAVVFLLSGRGTAPAAPPVAAGPSRSGALLPPSATSTPALPTATSDPAAGSVLIDAATDPRFGTGPVRFATPSRNIACVMSQEEVRCDVVERTWQLPPKPADCGQAFGTGAILVGSGAGELSCVGDTVADPALAVLGYGEAVRFAGVVCVSKDTGLRCENPVTRHGFSVARGSYQLF